MSITKISPSVVDFDAGITISTTDNSDNLTLTSTDADSSFGPNLNFYRNSSSPADDDLLAQIDFNGRNDNSQDVLYANIQTQIIDASDGTEDGRFQINTIVNGTDRNRFLLTPTETVFNENSIDLDFRVESDDHTHMLFVDAGNNAVGIKNSDPHDTSWAADGADTAQLSIGNTSSGSTYGILHLLGHNTQATRYSIGAGDGIMYLAYDDVNGAHRIKVQSDGSVTMPNQPAFSVRPAAQSNFAINTDHTIVFNNEVFDVGSNFNDGSSGTPYSFNAPVTGKYQLNIYMLLIDVPADCDYVYLTVNTSNRVYQTYFDAGVMDQTSAAHTLNLSVVADMDANDKAYIQLRQNGGSATMDLNTETYFSGYLVA